MYEACLAGELGICKWLAAHGAAADVSVKNNRGNSPMMAACREGHLHVMQWLAENGARNDLSTRNSTGHDNIAIAVTYGHLHVAQWLEETGTVESFRAQNESGLSLLGLACMEGHLELAQWLHDIGAQEDIRTPTSKGFTPMMLACRGGHLHVAKWLLQVGAGADIRTKNASGHTPMYASCERGNLEVMKWLYEVGAAEDIHTRTANKGFTPMLLACQLGFLHIAKWLKDVGANSDARLLSSNGHSPMYAALQQGHLHVADWLFKHGAAAQDIFTKTQSGSSPLDYAKHSKNLPVIRWLILHGVSNYLDHVDPYLLQSDFSSDALRLELYQELRYFLEECSNYNLLLFQIKVVLSQSFCSSVGDDERALVDPAIVSIADFVGIPRQQGVRILKEASWYLSRLLNIPSTVHDHPAWRTVNAKSRAPKPTPRLNAPLKTRQQMTSRAISAEDLDAKIAQSKTKSKSSAPVRNNHLYLFEGEDSMASTSSNTLSTSSPVGSTWTESARDEQPRPKEVPIGLFDTGDAEVNTEKTMITDANEFAASTNPTRPHEEAEVSIKAQESSLERVKVDEAKEKSTDVCQSASLQESNIDDSPANDSSSTKPSAAHHQSTSNLFGGTGGLFGGENASDQVKVDETKEKSIDVRQSASPQEPSIGDTSAEVVSSTTKPSAAHHQSTSNLFGDTGGLFGEENASNQVKVDETKEKSIRAGHNSSSSQEPSINDDSANDSSGSAPAAVHQGTSNLFGDTGGLFGEEDSSEQVKVDETNEESIDDSPEIASNNKSNAAQSSGGLFGDTGLFGDDASIPSANEKPISTKRENFSSLFGDDGGLFGDESITAPSKLDEKLPPPLPSPPMNLADDHAATVTSPKELPPEVASEEDMSSSLNGEKIDVAMVAESSVPVPNTPSVHAAEESSIASSGHATSSDAVFEDSNEADTKTTVNVSNPPGPGPRSGKGLFGDDDDDDDLVASNGATTEETDDVTGIRIAQENGVLFQEEKAEMASYTARFHAEAEVASQVQTEAVGEEVPESAPTVSEATVEDEAGKEEELVREFHNSATSSIFTFADETSDDESTDIDADNSFEDQVDDPNGASFIRQKDEVVNETVSAEIHEKIGKTPEQSLTYPVRKEVERGADDEEEVDDDASGRDMTAVDQVDNNSKESFVSESISEQPSRVSEEVPKSILAADTTADVRVDIEKADEKSAANAGIKEDEINANIKGTTSIPVDAAVAGSTANDPFSGCLDKSSARHDEKVFKSSPSAETCASLEKDGEESLPSISEQRDGSKCRHGRRGESSGSYGRSYGKSSRRTRCQGKVIGSRKDSR